MSVASACEGQGVIALAVRRGRVPHRLNTAVERRKARPASQAGALSVRARMKTCAVTALRFLSSREPNRETDRKPPAENPSARRKRRACKTEGPFSLPYRDPVAI